MDLKRYHTTVGQIIKLLDNKDVWYETFQHTPVTTSEEAAAIRHGYTLDQGAKAIIVRVKISNSNKYFAQLVFPGSAKINSKIVTKMLEAKNIRFASKDELSEITNGIEIGGIPPFGNLFKLPVYVDASILKQEKIIFNAGDTSFSIGMLLKDYIDIVNPKVESFT
jgi:prolyl-tRNA editing enzyme YbaK/EbsC (Cys-tRNA(Pro) deacylase)